MDARPLSPSPMIRGGYISATHRAVTSEGRWHSARRRRCAQVGMLPPWHLQLPQDEPATHFAVTSEGRYEPRRQEKQRSDFAVLGNFFSHQVTLQ
jgi:hypothetical protein